MTNSMTGFSSTIVSLPVKDAHTGIEQQLQLTIMLKTLNSRFFEVNCRLPTSLSFLETELIKYFKKELHRGTIQFTIYMSTPSALTGIIKPALSTVRGYLSAIIHMQKECNIPGSVTIQDLIMLPNIFEMKETPLSKETLDLLWNEIKTVTQQCKQSRLHEGHALEKDLRERITLLRTLSNELEVQSSHVIKNKKKQLLENLRTLLNEVAPDTTAESLISLTYNQLEKIAIHEEIVRFKTHIEKLDTILSSSEVSKGKKLDFTLQELFRETNTIASKCSDAQISNLAISIKVELEKAREQAQNIV